MNVSTMFQAFHMTTRVLHVQHPCRRSQEIWRLIIVRTHGVCGCIRLLQPLRHRVFDHRSLEKIRIERRSKLMGWNDAETDFA